MQAHCFQIMFTLQNGQSHQLQLPQISVESQNNPLAIAKFDLTLTIIETEQGLESHWEYRTALFDAETIEVLSKSFCHLIAKA